MIGLKVKITNVLFGVELMFEIETCIDQVKGHVRARETKKFLWKWACFYVSQSVHYM